MAKKKEATKKKESVTPNGFLPGTVDQIPKSVQDAATDFDKAHKAKAKATATANQRELDLIQVMRSTGTERCPILGGKQYLEVSAKDHIKYAKGEDETKPRKKI